MSFGSGVKQGAGFGCGCLLLILAIVVGPPLLALGELGRRLQDTGPAATARRYTPPPLSSFRLPGTTARAGPARPTVPPDVISAYCDALSAASDVGVLVERAVRAANRRDFGEASYQAGRLAVAAAILRNRVDDIPGWRPLAAATAALGRLALRAARMISGFVLLPGNDESLRRALDAYADTVAAWRRADRAAGQPC